jgi:hypothetical protein
VRKTKFLFILIIISFALGAFGQNAESGRSGLFERLEKLGAKQLLSQEIMQYFYSSMAIESKLCKDITGDYEMKCLPLREQHIGIRIEKNEGKYAFKYIQLSNKGVVEKELYRLSILIQENNTYYLKDDIVLYPSDCDIWGVVRLPDGSVMFIFILEKIIKS